MSSVYVEFALVSLAAAVSPTTVTFSILSVVLSKHPLRTGIWFWLGAFVITMAIGVAAAFILGDLAAPSTSGGRKTWVSIFDLVAGALLLVYVARTWRKPFGEKTTKGMVDKMTAVASSPWIAVFAAGATLANPGGFIPVALKTISEIGPTTAGFIGLWAVFAFVSLLPLGIAIVLMLASPDWAARLLRAVREWLEGHLRLLASAIILLLAIGLLRNGIAGLT